MELLKITIKRRETVHKKTHSFFFRNIPFEKGLEKKNEKNKQTIIFKKNSFIQLIQHKLNMIELMIERKNK